MNTVIAVRSALPQGMIILFAALAKPSDKIGNCYDMFGRIQSSNFFPIRCRTHAKYKIFIWPSVNKMYQPIVDRSPRRSMTKTRPRDLASRPRAIAS